MANPLAGLTPAELAQTPALMPPAGVVPNFINPPGTAIRFTLTTIFVLVRLAYTVDLLYTSDETYSIIKVGLWNVGELTTIILCACFPIMPKFIHWITGKTKNKSTYHPSAYADGYGLKGHNSKRSNQFSNPTASDNTMPWLDSEEHEIGLVGKSKGSYHNLDVGQKYNPKPSPISKVEPEVRVKGNVPGKSIWKTDTVRVDSSLDPERGGHDFV